jgi:cytokinin dehydrogenase
MQPGMMAGNQPMFEQVRRLGGTNYLFGALLLTHRDWQQHYGESWPASVRAKRRDDPDRVLASGPDLFPRS